MTRVDSANFLSDSVEVTTLQCLVCWRLELEEALSVVWKDICNASIGEVKIFKYISRKCGTRFTRHVLGGSGDSPLSCSSWLRKIDVLKLMLPAVALEILLF